MDHRTLYAIVSTLDPDTPLHKKMEAALRIGPEYGNAKYDNQKHHWMTWLATYDDPSCSRRQYRSRTGAELVYNRLNCPPMVFWLAEAVYAPRGCLLAALDACLVASKNTASQTASVRKHLPWNKLEERLSLILQSLDVTDKLELQPVASRRVS